MQRFIIEELRKWKTFKGALAENYILTALSSQFEVPPYYWTEIPHEVDFI